jgi:hypothetical protein
MHFAVCLFVTSAAGNAFAQPLKTNPLPEDYVKRNGGGATIVPNGQLTLDDHPAVCGRTATVFDSNLTDYGAYYPRFVILNPRLMQRVPTPVKLWIFGHECGHISGVKNEPQADCFAVRRGLREGWLSPHGIEQICDFISAGRADVLHPSGPQRCALIRQCYGSGNTASSPRRMPARR